FMLAFRLTRYARRAGLAVALPAMLLAGVLAWQDMAAAARAREADVALQIEQLTADIRGADATQRLSRLRALQNQQPAAVRQAALRALEAELTTRLLSEFYAASAQRRSHWELGRQKRELTLLLDLYPDSMELAEAS